MSMPSGLRMEARISKEIFEDFFNDTKILARFTTEAHHIERPSGETLGGLQNTLAMTVAFSDAAMNLKNGTSMDMRESCRHSHQVLKDIFDTYEMGPSPSLQEWSSHLRPHLETLSHMKADKQDSALQIA